MTANQIQYWRNVETKRSNMAQEAETARHNKAGESLENRRVKLEETYRPIEAIADMTAASSKLVDAIIPF